MKLNKKHQMSARAVGIEPTIYVWIHAQELCRNDGIPNYTRSHSLLYGIIGDVRFILID